jgi:prepilin signal peptidase PulO-like enzyme (type II secretory pathway)
MSLDLFLPILSGWLAGWLINYLADVLPVTRRVSLPTCSHCGKAFRWLEYLSLRNCTHCGQRRSLRTWVVQISLMVASLYLWLYPHSGLGFPLSLFLLSYLVVVIVIDLEHRLILHTISIFGAVFGLGLGIYLHGVASTLIGGLVGLGLMLVLYLFGLLFSRLRARRLQTVGKPSDEEEALGAGDVILNSLLGLLLGWPLIWFCLLLGILAGGIVGLFVMLYSLASRRYPQQALMLFIPYGPFFILSTIVLLYLPNWISSLALK